VNCSLNLVGRLWFVLGPAGAVIHRLQPPGA
jgi:hypothetical protein